MIVFKNEGILDINSIITFGVSVKEKESAIGFFGTGLKYAIAVLLRNGCDISIKAGENVYNFGTEELIVRGKSFPVITMNGKPLSFTTEYGKTWELWQAARELYSNCLDEGGVVTEEIDDSFHGTQVIVMGESFDLVWKERHTFLLDAPVLWANDRLDVCEGPSEYAYYQGIRAYTLPTKSKFTYNLKNHQKLTEDRALANWWGAQWDITWALASCDNKDVLERVIINNPEDGEDWLEAGFSFEGMPTGATLNELVGFHIRNKTEGLNKTLLKEAMNRSLLESTPEEFAHNLSPEDVTIIKDAIEMVLRAGFDTTAYTIGIVESLGEGETSWASEDKIYVSRLAMEAGAKKVAAIILLSILKIENGLYTESAEMQEFLLDLVIKLAMRK